MDTAWAFREAYEHARKLKEAQDDFCAKARKGEWAGLEAYPEDLQWEALVDVLRGRVKVGEIALELIKHRYKSPRQVQTHCYETIDLDDLVRVWTFR